MALGLMVDDACCDAVEAADIGKHTASWRHRMCKCIMTLIAALLLMNPAVGAQGPQLPPSDATQPLSPLPAGWSPMTGNGGPEALPGTCEIGVDGQKSMPDRQAYSVRCANKVLPSFGGARNTVQTARFRGKRVRVSAWLMASGVEGVSTPQYSGVAAEAGLWLGVGSPKDGMRMDRMQNRAIKGSTDWEYRDFIVDVPADNRQMMVGYWMQGTGQIWVRDFSIEEVPSTVAVNFLVNDPDRVVGPDLSLLSSTAARAGDRFLAPPARWLAMGGKGYELCDAGVDVQMLQGGQRNLSIACAVPQAVMLRQAVEAAPFWGKRVRFSGWLKLENFEPLPATGGMDGSGLFISSTVAQPQTLRSNVSAASGWQLSELVMDVPRNSAWLLVGLTLNGKGQVWARDFRFEEVSRDTPVTQPAAIRF
jgi:hypothetical protein